MGKSSSVMASILLRNTSIMPNIFPEESPDGEEGVSAGRG
jgi:hypothetical protein